MTTSSWPYTVQPDRHTSRFPDSNRLHHPLSFIARHIVGHSTLACVSSLFVASWQCTMLFDVSQCQVYLGSLSRAATAGLHPHYLTILHYPTYRIPQDTKQKRCLYRPTSTAFGLPRPARPYITRAPNLPPF